jgi:uncharacterized protein (DUF1800 family)
MLKLRTAIAANRFGLGATPQEAIGSEPERWLLQQIETAPGDRKSQSDTGRPESADLLEQVTELRLARQAAQSARNNQAIEVDEEAIREFGRFISQAYQTQATSGLLEAISSEQPFRERLVRFWTNHFAVSADKQPVGAIAGSYRDEAIRPRVTGNFRDLLTAAVQHPAMLLYLDNQTSIGPTSLLGARANRARGAGLNENLAREVLELHTLGVDGGYTQDDVIEFAKALTGWSIGGAGALERLGAMARRLTGSDEGGTPGEFAFRTVVHEPGAKTILGQRFREGGVDEAESVLDYLALQPQTARHLATKLARHFVQDEPPPALVDRLATAYLDSGGELAPVYRTLIESAESWRDVRGKYKTPEEFLISAYRATGVRTRARSGPANSLVAVATQLGQRPLTPGSPAGWPDIAAQWNSGDALLKRIEWATVFGASIGDRIDAKTRIDEVLGETASDSTRTGISRAESGGQAMALLVSAPEFQWR